MDVAQVVAEGIRPFWVMFWQWLLPAVLGLSGLKLLVEPALKGAAGEKRVGRLLGKMAAEVRNDVLLPDGNGGLTQIDHLALGPSGIWVVETKNYGGSIFGKAAEKRWTQKLGGQSFRFQNPLRQNHAHIKALELVLPDAPIFGRVVFTDRARFPKGVPEGVTLARDMARELQTDIGTGDISPALQAKWEALAHRIRIGKEARKAHRQGLQRKHGKSFRKPLAVGLLGAGGVVFVAAHVLL